MPRGVKKEIVYTGKALKLHEKYLKLETEIKAVKAERDAAYKEQLIAEKEAEKKAKKASIAAKKKTDKENQAKIMKALKESGKTPEEILAFLGGVEKV